MKRIACLVLFVCMGITILMADLQKILATNDVIGYIVNKNLYVMSANIGEEQSLDLGVPIEDFCWDYSGRIIYFLSFNENSSMLSGYRYDPVAGEKTRLFSTKINSQGEVDYLGSHIKPTKNFDFLVQSDFGGDFPWFYEYHLYNAQKNILVKYNDWDEIMEAFDPLRCMETFTDRVRDIYNKHVDGHYELYIDRHVQDGEYWKHVPERLTRTNKLARMGTDDELICFCFSPDAQQVVFGVGTTAADVIWGATLIINQDGTGQSMLSEDTMLGSDFQYAWTTDSKLIYVTDKDMLTEDRNWSPDSNVLRLRSADGNTADLKTTIEPISSLHYREIGFFFKEWQDTVTNCGEFSQSLIQVMRTIDANKELFLSDENIINTACYVLYVLMGKYIEFYDHSDVKLCDALAALEKDPSIILVEGRKAYQKNIEQFENAPKEMLSQLWTLISDHVTEYQATIGKVEQMLDICSEVMYDPRMVTSAKAYDVVAGFPRDVMMSLTNATDLPPHRLIISDLADWLEADHARILDYDDKMYELEDKYFNQ